MGCVNGNNSNLNEPPPQGNKTKRKLPNSRLEAGRGYKQQGVHELKQNYYIDSQTKVIGVGNFGKVFLTHNKHDHDLWFAIKVLDKDKLRENLSNINDEIATLNTLDHPNIVKYYETYNDQKYIYLVMEYVKGMPMYEKIVQQENQTFTEESAARYMKQLF